ncbi:MAG: hypothetical protein E7404_03895 [Ruminococcaceae bacterium]|nr:hypothetical protein [Oscillospiraceae bacterium]
MNIKRVQVLTTKKEAPWMDMAVLNPAIIEYKDKMIMLFRTKGSEGKAWDDPEAIYPIAVGFGISNDGGETWDFDTSRPALFPKCELDIDKVFVTNKYGKKVPNCANGSIEDPRLFMIEDKCYLTVACRLFPLGNLWWNNNMTRMVPDWTSNEDNPFGKSAKDNPTVTVLYEVNLEKLVKRDYDNAFYYLTHLSNPDFGENRDIVFLPEKQLIDGKMQYVMIERPVEPFRNPYLDAKKPSMVFSAAETFYDFVKEDNKKVLIAEPTFEWEANRIGASAPPIRIDDKHWLLCYHGKQDDKVGYTQNFMVFKDRENDFPELIYHKDERLITVSEEWEKPGKFHIPCIFVTGMVKKDDKLILAYGAADERVGLMTLDYNELLNHLKDNGLVL